MNGFDYTYTTTSPTIVQAPANAIDQLDAMSGRLEDITAMKRNLLLEEGQILEKALTSNDPHLIMKAQNAMSAIEQYQESDLKSLFYDPHQLLSNMGYKRKAGRIGMNMLRAMGRIPTVRSIISHRQTQVSHFARPQRGRFDTGFVIQLRPEYYEQPDSKNLSAKDRKIRNYITEFLLNCGSNSNKWHGDSFSDFLCKIVDDSLTLDHAPFEIAANLGNEPTEFAAVDGATIMVADSIDDSQYSKEMGQRARVYDEKYGYYPSWVQVWEGQVLNEYYPWEMCVGIRNRVTDVRKNGYGRSELEDLIEIVTYMLYTDQYNGNNFTNGSMPRGFFKVNRGASRSKIEQFRMQWAAMVASWTNAHRIPVLESDTAEWIDMAKTNREMEYEKWQNYLIRILCAVYKIAPEEIGFDLSKSEGAVSYESGNEAKIKYSRDKGLKPLLTHLESWVNKWIVQRIDPRFEFRFVGIDMDRDKELERDIKLAESFGGYKEARAKWDLPAELEDGDFPLNAAYIQRIGQIEMAEQMQSQSEAAEGAAAEGEEGSGVWDSLDADEAIEKGANPMMIDAIAAFNEGVR